MQRSVRGKWVAYALVAAACGGAEQAPGSQPTVCARAASAVEPPACGSASYEWRSLIADPKAPGFDAALGAKAERIERQFHALNAHRTGANADASVPGAPERALVEDFVDSGGWDFAARAGKPVEQVIASWAKVAGAYAGPGIAADAMRYATLRDQGAACDEVARARDHLLAGIEVLHTATAITGVPGVVARALARKDVPGDGAFETTPLFDAAGAPLPAEKNNGTWREDSSGGRFSGFIWEDSCSRDMLIGWAVGYTTAWEVIARDPSFSEDVKARMRADAAAIARSLMQVGSEGYDLEIHDADGRLTFHGYLNENAIEHAYVPDAGNGLYAIMALGIVGGLAFVAGEPDIDAYVNDGLVAARELPRLARDSMLFVDLGVGSNFSNYHMAFTGGWLAHRYLCLEPARATVREAVRDALYARPGRDRQPAEQKQSFFDLVYVASQAGAHAEAPVAAVDEAALARALETLTELPDAPFWEIARENCDAAEIAAGSCTGDDGTPITLIGNEGWGDKLVAEAPIPMRIRPPSNYYWRSNPYEPNGGGDGTRLLPASDLRVVYWMGRWLRRP